MTNLRKKFYIAYSSLLNIDVYAHAPISRFNSEAWQLLTIQCCSLLLWLASDVLPLKVICRRFAYPYGIIVQDSVDHIIRLISYHQSKRCTSNENRCSETRNEHIGNLSVPLTFNQSVAVKFFYNFYQKAINSIN